MSFLPGTETQPSTRWIANLILMFTLWFSFPSCLESPTEGKGLGTHGLHDLGGFSFPL